MKYKVLKEFIDNVGICHHVGSTYGGEPIGVTGSPTIGQLLDHGFIEEITGESWKPKPLIDTYYSIELGDEVDAHLWTGNELDKAYMEIGNCFQTREQAEDAVEWLKAFKVLRDDAKGFQPDWKNRKYNEPKNYYVFYEHYTKQLLVLWDNHSQSEIIYFATQADAERSIKKHEKEWKIFLGVSDEN